MKIKITSKRKGSCLLHFIVNGKPYIMQTGDMNGDYTLKTHLYAGLNKCHCKLIGFTYGGMEQILNGTYAKKTIKQIDTKELEEFLKCNFKESIKEWNNDK